MSAILAIVCGFLVLVADQITKHLCETYMELGEVITLIPGVLSLDRIVPNSGAAFGILAGKTWFLITVTLIIMIICVGLLIRKTFDSKIMFWALCLVLSGGMGNMIDRLFNDGKVVDFLRFDFINFPVFNVADCAVCIGAGLMILYFIMDLIKDSKKKNPIDIINAQDDSIIEEENAKVGESNEADKDI